MRRLLPWLALLVVVGGALVVGTRGDGRPSTPEARVESITQEVRCPTCQGLSAADSTAPAAQAVRTFVAEQVRAGRSDDEIRAELVARYGRDILLRPEAGGVAGLVWVLPVMALVCGAVGLAVTFRRWQRRGRLAPSDDDRRLVEEALRR